MGGSMSQEQIDALLSGVSADDGDASGAVEEASANSLNENTTQNNNISNDDAMSNKDDLPDDNELSLLGEIYNISMGAAAKAVATLIKMKVDISTPSVSIIRKDSLVFKTLEPAVGVIINYVEGLYGENIFILSQHDIMKLVNIVLGRPGEVDESEEFSDMHLSAIGEIMNQMMGASSINVAEFLNMKIDISVPETFKIEGQFPSPSAEKDDELIVATSFNFIVGDIINSQMITTCTLAFAKDIIHKAMVNFGMLPADDSPPPVIETPPEPEIKPAPTPPVQEEVPPPVEIKQPEPEPQPVQQAPPPQVQPQPEPQPQPQYQPQQMPVYQQPYPQQMPVIDPNLSAMISQQTSLLMALTEKLTNTNTMQTQAPPPMQTTAQQYPNVSVQPAGFRAFDDTTSDNTGTYDNMELVLDLPLDVAIEIGRTRKTVNEVLELGEGSIIELDKQSADPVDVWVNGNLVAKGTVVVIEENFAVRITEIVSPQDKLKAARNKKEK